MELLRNRFDFDKYKFTATMNETAKQRVVNMELAERRLELQERGIDIDELDKSERRNLASKMFAEDKRMNIHKMSEDEKNRHLTEQLANYSNHWKGRADEVARMSLTQKKELWKEEMAFKTRMAHIEGEYTIGAAAIKAKAPKPTEVKAVTDNDLLEMENFLEAHPDIEKRIKNSGIGPWYTGGNDTEQLSALSSKYKAWKGKNKGRGMTNFFDAMVGSKTGASDGGDDNFKGTTVKKKKGNQE
jgi:hypothetical protein